MTTQHKIKREQYGILFDVADRRKLGKIGMSEWATFDNLLKKSDSGYELAFRIFDTEGTGFVKSEVFWIDVAVLIGVIKVKGLSYSLALQATHHLCKLWVCHLMSSLLSSNVQRSPV